MSATIAGICERSGKVLLELRSLHAVPTAFIRNVAMDRLRSAPNTPRPRAPARKLLTFSDYERKLA